MYGLTGCVEGIKRGIKTVTVVPIRITTAARTAKTTGFEVIPMMAAPVC
jgi:hypothetical protein